MSGVMLSIARSRHFSRVFFVFCVLALVGILLGMIYSLQTLGLYTSNSHRIPAAVLSWIVFAWTWMDSVEKAVATKKIIATSRRFTAAFKRISAAYERIEAAHKRNAAAKSITAAYNRTTAAHNRTTAAHNRTTAAYQRLWAAYNRSLAASNRFSAAYERNATADDKRIVAENSTGLPTPAASMAQHHHIEDQPLQVSRWSCDSGQGTEQNSASLPGHSRTSLELWADSHASLTQPLLKVDDDAEKVNNDSEVDGDGEINVDEVDLDECDFDVDDSEMDDEDGQTDGFLTRTLLRFASHARPSFDACLL